MCTKLVNLPLKIPLFWPYIYNQDVALIFPNNIASDIYGLVYKTF